MGRKKNPETKDRFEDIRDKLERAKQHRKAMAQAKAKPKKETAEVSYKQAFSEFWAQKKKEYKRSKDLENVLWAHLKAIGMDKPELFEKGLAHFGLKK